MVDRSYSIVITLRKLVVFRGRGQLLIQNGPIGFRKLAPSDDYHLPFSPPLLLYPWRSKSLHQNLLRPPQERHIKRGAHQYNHCWQHSSVTWLIPCICTSLQASFLARPRDSPCYCAASKLSNLLHCPF